MYIIDESYFIKQLVIPNRAEIDVDGATTPFDVWIDEQARLCLQNALGNVLFADFDSNITNGVIDPGAPQKWLDLVNGTDYAKDGVTYTWKGLKYEEGAFKGSLLAYYVYCKWLEYQLSYQSGIGEVRGMAANSSSVGTTHRYVTTWNTFVEMYQGKHTSKPSLTIINGVPFYDYYGDAEEGYVSLLQFLYDNDGDYPDAQATEYGRLNTFGI